MTDRDRGFREPELHRGIPVRVLHALAWGTIIGPLVLTAAWLVLGSLRPGFSHISQPISGLGVGPNATAMNAAFIACGVATLMGIGGVFAAIPEMNERWRRICVLLLSISAIGEVFDGIFTFESFMLHFAGFLLAVGSCVVSFPIVGFCLRSIPRWRTFGKSLVFGGALTLALLLLFFATFNVADVSAGHGFAGLTERLVILEMQTWFVMLGWLALGGTPRETAIVSVRSKTVEVEAK
jgi:lipoprotein signal peptidase